MPDRPITFLDFVEATDRARTFEELSAILIRSVETFGYDRINFTLNRVLDLSDGFLGHGIINTYPTDWKLYYLENDLARIDPVLRLATGAQEPFLWTEIGQRLKLSSKEISFMRMGQEEARLYHGVGLPFKGPRAQVGGIALASSVRGSGKRLPINLLHAYVEQFFKAYRRLAGIQPIQIPRHGILSPREAEVLFCMSQDYTDAQIATALKIGLDTVKTYKQRINQKLDSQSAKGAVAKGLRYFIIE